MAETFILIPGRTSRQGTTLNEGKLTTAYVEETSTLFLCPDEGDHITKAKNACVLGKAWFLNPHVEDRPVVTIEGKPATLEEGIERAAQILANARYPIVVHPRHGGRYSTMPKGCSCRKPTRGVRRKNMN